jgi:hypothetical protein
MQRSLFAAMAAVALALSAGGASAGPASTTMPNGKSIYGVPVQASPNHRVVDMKATEHLNIVCGDMITFRNGDKSFSWKFDVVNHRAVNLQAIAPADFGAKSLMIYVDRNEMERS